jgi:hypothetical protein
MISLTVLIFIAIGGILVYVAGIMKTGLEDACNAGDGTVAEIFNELYSTVDDIYCRSSAMNGCDCASVSFVPNPARSTPEAYSFGGSSDMINVQECTSYLENVFANYGIDFDSVSDIVDYLDYFGDIEDGYSCSGICDYQSVYYFSDITSGAPDGSCEGNIRDDLITHVIEGSGIAYIVTGCFILCIWFIQYGLCCRKKNLGNPGAGGSKKF